MDRYNVLQLVPPKCKTISAYLCIFLSRYMDEWFKNKRLYFILSRSYSVTCPKLHQNTQHLINY